MENTQDSSTKVGLWVRIKKRIQDIEARVHFLYRGRSTTSVYFRFFLLLFDVITIAFFILSSMVGNGNLLLVLRLEIGLGVILLIDYLLRLWIARNKLRRIFSLMEFADLLVILSLLMPMVMQNFGFLRIIRSLRLLRSYRVLRDLRERYAFFAHHEEIIQSTLNLLVFIFFMTALVFVMQVNVNPAINNYIDALYFTVTTLTTTGFGDITLEGTTGRLLAVGIMVIGVALFLRLIQAIFRPPRVQFECPACGLSRHESDAVHCRHCGQVLHIGNEAE